MKIYFDDRGEQSTVAIEGNVPALLDLARSLRNEHEFAIVCERGQGAPYSRLLDKLIFKRTSKGKGNITVAVEDDQLVLSGDVQAAEKLALSLENVFVAGCDKGTHFHLDYLDENSLLAPTKLGVIFQCSF